MTDSLDNYFKKHPRRIFIVDGSGAILSALCLGIIIPMFKQSFGMPLHILELLAILAVLLSAYSFCCYLFISVKWVPFLKLIILANILYCILTLLLVVYYFRALTGWDLTYFLLELLVIILIIKLEHWVLTRFF